jgi:hypothetical protein
MVRAILEGRKTQTRRLNGLDDVNSYPGEMEGSSFLGPFGYRGLLPNTYYLREAEKPRYQANPGIYHWFAGRQGNEINPIPVKCPYGKPGDLLWVRETAFPDFPKDFSYYDWTWAEVPEEYRTPAYVLYQASSPDPRLKWKPSIHMPRWASRLTLRITGIRVERVQSISEEDAVAEGITPLFSAEELKRPEIAKCFIDKPVGWTNYLWHGHIGRTITGKQSDEWEWQYSGYDSAAGSYSSLWESINGGKPGASWADNPWCWVVEFQREEAPHA